MPTKIKVNPTCTFDEFQERAGTFVQKGEIHTVINYDCDAYDAEGNPLFFFRKGVLDPKICKQAYLALRKAARRTNNRGDAAGYFNPTLDPNFHYGGFIGNEKNKSKSFQRIKRDGTVSKTTTAKSSESGIIGYFDRSVRFPYCRTTAWTQENMTNWGKAIPYIQAISSEFEKACPERHEAQKQVWSETHPDFRIKDTVFTTVTVNRNFRTAIHCDAGDYEGGLGNIAVLQAGNFDFGYTCLPRYGIGFDVRTTDVCFFNVHEWHGNIDFEAKKPFERISIVCYYRQNMMHCKSSDEELMIVKNRKDLSGLHA
ncbi:MAG: hypothetical protein VW683_02785 [Betaproteobacteria bacterium]